MPVTPPRTGQVIDAIIVPTRRPVAQLGEVAKAALALRSPLVTLHSGRSRVKDAVDALPADLDLIAIDVSDARHLQLPRLATSQMLSRTAFRRQSDLSAKRNLAIVLGHLVGWSRVFFLDDDIQVISADDLRRACGLLSKYHAVGLYVGGYPDNSVVCHAYRESGGSQQSFVGAGALAVDIVRCDSFFPDIYNDDWFFLLDGDHRLRPTAVTGQVLQYQYDPFQNPGRARSEEFGDVLAEGLYWLLDQGKSVHSADLRHWENYLVLRKAFIESVLKMVSDDGALREEEKAKRVRALQASLGRLELVTPQVCQSYLSAWMTDLRRWRQFTSRLPTDLPVHDAVARLTRRGLLGQRRLDSYVGRPTAGHASPAPGCEAPSGHN